MTGPQTTSFRMEIGTQTSLLMGAFAWLTPYEWWIDTAIIVGLALWEVALLAVSRNQWEFHE